MRDDAEPFPFTLCSLVSRLVADSHCLCRHPVSCSLLVASPSSEIMILLCTARQSLRRAAVEKERERAGSRSVGKEGKEERGKTMMMTMLSCAG